MNGTFMDGMADNVDVGTDDTGGGESTAEISAESALESASSRLESESSPDSTGNAAASVKAAALKPQGPNAAGAINRPVKDAPDSRIEVAVRNARAEVEGRLGWAKDLTKEEALHAVQVYRRMAADPHAFVKALLAEAGAGQAEEEEEELVDPDGDLISEDGKTKAYSEGAVKKLMQNLTSRLRAEMKPALTFAQKAEQEAQTRETVRGIVQESRQVASQAWETISKAPHFEENRAAISEAFAAIDPAFRRQVGSVAALYMAYNKVLAEQVLPNNEKKVGDKNLKDLQRSAVASAGNVRPGSKQAPKAKIKDGDVDALAAHMERMYSGSE